MSIQLPAARRGLFLLALLAAVPASGQAPATSPYRLSLKQELLFGGAAAGAYLWSRSLQAATEEVLLTDLHLARPSTFDRFATGLDSRGARLFSDHTRDAAKFLPLLLLAGRDSRRDAGKLTLLFAEAFFLNKGVTDIIKATVRRPRPYVHVAGLAPMTVIDGGDRSSFLSGHTSGAAMGGFFFVRTFSDYYPDSKLGPLVWVFGAGLPAVTGYLRVRAGYHFPSDVVAGYALGALIGYGVPALHRRRGGVRRVTLLPTGTGMYLSYRW